MTITLFSGHTLGKPIVRLGRTSRCRAVPLKKIHLMYLLKITLANGLPQTPQNPDNSHQDRFAAKRTAHRRAWPWWWLQAAWADISSFFCAFQTLGPGSVERRESRRPHVEGGPMPPPPAEKIRTPIFLQFGACPDFSCRDTLRTRSGSVSRKFWVAPLAKKIRTPFSPQFRGVSRFFFQETAVGVCPENFGYPSPAGAGQGA